MTQWWRAYNEAVDDPKLILLSDRIFRAWFNLLCLASSNGGVLPAIEIMVIKLRMPENKIGLILEELIQRELLDEFDGVLRPHNWNGRQYKSDVTDPTNAERQRRYRERHADRYVTVTNTVTETGTVTLTREEQNTDTESKKEDFRPKRVRTDYPKAFEQDFWKSYPRTPLMSKTEAFKVWGKLSEEDRLSATSSLPKYRAFLASKPDHPAVHACRFLSQRRFDGFAEIVESEPTGPPVPPDPSMPSDDELRKKYAVTGDGCEAERGGLRGEGDGLREENKGGGWVGDVPDNPSRQPGMASLGSVFRRASRLHALHDPGGIVGQTRANDGTDAMAGMVRSGLHGPPKINGSAEG